MSEALVVHATDQVRRLFYRPVETVFNALSDHEKLRSWYDSGSSSDVQDVEVDFTVGGRKRVAYKFRSGTPMAGKTLVNEERFLNIVPNQRIVTSSIMMMEGEPFSVSLLTFEISPSGPGSELTVTHQDAFFENSDGPEMRRAGWAALMEWLGKVVETVDATQLSH
jgi:uncharacterized protein YndB with AHSA1/START domain